MNALTPAFMKGYFGDAAKLEKQKYVFQGALNETNGKLNHIKTEREKTRTKKVNFENLLANINERYSAEERNLEEKKTKNQIIKNRFGRMKKIFLPLIIVFGVILAFTWLLTFGFNASNELPSKFSGLFLLFIGLVYLEAGMVALLIISNIKVRKAKAYLEQAEKRNLSVERLNEQNELIESINECGQKISTLNNAEASLTTICTTLNKNFHAVRNALSSLYSKNLIAPNYHNFTAMATFHHYLATGRCLQVFGHGGVIDTYEKDLQAKLVYSMLLSIRDIAMDNNVLMSQIRDEAVATNRELININRSLGNIESSNEDIARSNQEISNYCISSAQTLKEIYARY